MILFTAIFLIIDICSKIIISKYLELNQSIRVIKNFLNITYVRNTGVAWSILNNQSIVVIILSSIVTIAIILYIKNNKPTNTLEKLSYSLILGGAIGNLIERIIHGYVTDFIDINLFGYNYPIFNMADTFIVIGVILIIITTWRCKHDRNESNKQRKHKD